MGEPSKARCSWKNDSLGRKSLNSFNGLKTAFFMETAIARETACAFLLTALAIYAGKGNFWLAFRVFLLSLVPMVIELINTSLELLIDSHVGTDFNEDVKRTKDMLSASVLLALVISYGAVLALIVPNWK
jgi:diacylglycerol kinase (ATP)